MTEAILEECHHLLPRVLCRTCSASFWDKMHGKLGPLTVQERKDVSFYHETVHEALGPVLAEAEANLADVKRKIERYRSTKL